MKMYINNKHIISGITLKNKTKLESNNMALHTCQNKEHVLLNRNELANSLHCDLNHFVMANQTHSANFHKVTAIDKGRGVYSALTAIENTDALYTYEQNLLLCSFTADCVPVLFYHEANGLVGVIHSGWQGTVKEITSKLFTHLIQVEQCNPNDFHVQIGPALSQEKFEVDEDVYVKFKKLCYADEFIDYNEETNKYHIDNQLTVKKQCELAGIPAAQITIDRMCTYVSDNGFSYREDKQCGRHLSFIMKPVTTSF